MKTEIDGEQFNLIQWVHNGRLQINRRLLYRKSKEKILKLLKGRNQIQKD